MMETEQVKIYLDAGLCVLPCKMPEKKPKVESWTQFQKIRPTPGQHQINGAMGIVTGEVSENLFVLDLDLKYDLTGTLLERLENEIGAELWDRIFQAAYIQKTINNGLHIFLRCEQIESSMKLAQRPATKEELEKSPHDKVRVLLETRGEGGFIVCAPTLGYEVVSGSLLGIGFISMDDKERLFEACRSFNEVFTEIKPPSSKKFTNDFKGLTPWEDYNQKVNGADYILSQGWTYLKTVGENQHYCRAGKKGTTSGTWNESLGLFHCFTTSSQLEGDKSYSPFALFTYMECNGDFTEAGRRLYAMGYGERYQPPRLNTASVIPDLLNLKDTIFYNVRGESFMMVDGGTAKEISNKKLHEFWYQIHPDAKTRPAFNTFYHRLLAESTGIDPWNNIFETPWSGHDQFAILSKYVTAERETFIKDLSKHMIRGINQVYNDPKHRLINRYVFCIQSEQKHIGKSTLIGKLSLSNISGFGGEKDLSENSKEIKRSMCQLFNMIWEEVDSLMKREVNNLKTLISLSSYSGRVLYSEQQSTKPRTSTLWATVNPRDFLGSTDKRWIVHPVTDIDFGYTDNVDFLDMWRQCYAIWKENHNAGELTKEELESHEVTASEHINYSPLEEELMTIFSPDEKRNEFNVMSINQIIKVLQPNLDTIQRGQQTQVGFAVSKIFGAYKYPKSRYRNNKGTFYHLIKKDVA